MTFAERERERVTKTAMAMNERKGMRMEDEGGSAAACGARRVGGCCDSMAVEKLVSLTVSTFS